MTDLLDYLRSGTARGYLTADEAFTVLSRHLEEDREREEEAPPAGRSLRAVEDGPAPVVEAGTRVNKQGKPVRKYTRKAKVEAPAAPNGVE